MMICRKKIAPNLKKMCSKGLVEKIITNGQVTKFVVPSILLRHFLWTMVDIIME